jgi:5-methylcytosine-specific restriction endonuclease McrA
VFGRKRANKDGRQSRCVWCEVAYRAERRALAYGYSGEHFTGAQWEALVRRHAACLRCGTDYVSLTADHVVPLCKGGANDITNIQPLCLRCNSQKGAAETDYRS